jgi:teichoic acid glycerol-phosphate primase
VEEIWQVEKKQEKHLDRIFMIRPKIKENKSFIQEQILIKENMEEEKIFASDTCVLIYGQTSHYIDHLAPLSCFLQIPLIVSSKEHKDLILKYYPDVKLFYIEPANLPWILVKKFSYIISCLPKAYLEEAFSFAQDCLHKKVHFIWHPHGNSDKGWENSFMKKLKCESLLLIYGQKMADTLKAMDVDAPYIPIGNVRKWYYEKHRSFYQKFLQEEVFSFLSNRRSKGIFLFAPTWDDREHLSSFSYLTQLASEIPEDFSLLIKLHPNTWKQKASDLVKMESFFAEKKNIFLLKEEFLTIYPLLDKIDLYIGDSSSIGYDYLYFQKPMCFFNPQKKGGMTTFLFPCGKEIVLDKGNLFSQITTHFLQKDPLYETRQKKMYDFTFADLISRKVLELSMKKLLPRVFH